MKLPALNRCASALFILCALAARPAWSDAGVVAAQARTVTSQLTAFAKVVPQATVELRALAPGTVRDLRVLAGDHVAAGQPLLTLAGSRTRALIVAARAEVGRRAAEVDQAAQTVAIEKEKLAANLSTRERVLGAETALTGARANLDAARASYAAASRAAVIRAPEAGTLAEVAVANGESVDRDQVVMRLIPVHGLWLEAVYYGTDLQDLKPGMTGRFAPAGGGPETAVRLRSLIGPDAGGGYRVGLAAAAPNPPWVDGEAGTVKLAGTSRTLPAVPSHALVLEAGNWWVLVRTPGGYERRQVVPGPEADGWTLIASGLAVGTPVVSEGVYDLFHRDFSRRYQQPD